MAASTTTQSPKLLEPVQQGINQHHLVYKCLVSIIALPSCGW
jgi:hypothetical protein